MSATLSEYLLRSFDAAISNYPGVRFYSRYVDDGIILVSDKVDLADLRIFVEKKLPDGLNLNRSKTKPYQFSPCTKGNIGNREHVIKFLGYVLGISEIKRSPDKILVRDVHVDIALSKISNIKKRIALSLLDFNDGGNYHDLHGRIKLLTSNFGFIDDTTGQQRYSGIRYNYSLIDPTNSPQLILLDRFLINVVTSKHPNNRLRPNLSNAQRSALLGFSFSSGFLENLFFTFDNDRLEQLIGCWAHA